MIPSGLGVSGEVLSKNYIHIQNNILRDHKYMSDVDNQTDIKNVKNIMIGPVFGHQKDAVCEMIPSGSESENESQDEK